jgi:carnitine 3-dehydrogenase
VRQYVEAAWAALTKIGLTQGASTSRLRFESNLKEALAGVDMVQENAPEREPLKIKLVAEIDSILPPSAILVSSTSGIPMSAAHRKKAEWSAFLARKPAIHACLLLQMLIR